MATDSELSRKITRLERDLEKIKRSQFGYTHGDIFGTFKMLPELRGFWPFSSVNETNMIFDMSAQNRILTNNNNATRSLYREIMPIISFNGTNQYLSRPDEVALSITGAMTMGGWFKRNTTTTASYLMSKFAGAGARGYGLLLGDSSARDVGAYVSSNGTLLTHTSTSLQIVLDNTWIFAAMRFTPSTELAIFESCSGLLSKTSNTTSIPASQFDNTNVFTIGSNSVPALYFDGSAALCFLCASAIPDKMLNRVYSVTRTYFDI
jgi:hypothetical protein